MHKLYLEVLFQPKDRRLTIEYTKITDTSGHFTRTGSSMLSGMCNGQCPVLGHCLRALKGSTGPA